MRVLQRHLFTRVFAVVICCASVRLPAQDAEQRPSDRTGNATQLGAEPQVDPVLVDVENAIRISSRRYLTGNVHTPWQIIHGVLALRNDFMIKVDDGKTSALEWMARGQTFRGEPWFEVTSHGGRAHVFSEAYAFEGHPNQFLAILTVSDLPLDHVFQADRGKIAIADMVKHAQAEVNDREEITWTLWALSHYLPPDTEWTNRAGEQWSVERLVRIQTDADVHDEACGGTHGMFALSRARNSYIRHGTPLRGVWTEADQKIQRYIEEARSYQNPDGSYSNAFFQGREYSGDFETRMASSGHTLEFLMEALPQHRLNEQWVRNGVAATARDLIEHRSESMECGPLYHAVSGLVIYRNRLREALKQTAAAPAESAPSGTRKPQ
ncbi:MAG: hypothetical protein ABGZ17_05225, partial [Planctomycetaceae bacterium]